MAAPARNGSSSTGIEVDAISADMFAQEMHEHADNVEHSAGESGTPRIAAARVRNLRRMAGKFERVAAAAEADE